MKTKILTMKGKRNVEYRVLLFTLAALWFLLCSCKKQLDVKPSLSLQVPVTLADFQAVMDNNNVLTQVWPFAGTDGADDGFITDATWASVTITGRNAYIWDKNVFNDAVRNDWSLPYSVIFYANLVLEGTVKNGDDGPAWKNVQGQAAFFRGYAYYHLAQEFCKPYDQATAATDPGLVIRASSDLNVKSTRSTVAQTYAQMTADLLRAAAELPVEVVVKTRPGKAAAFAMLARTYLLTGDHVKAAAYADSCLALSGKLMDYNALTAGTAVSFKRFNDEVIFHTVLFSSPVITAPRYLVDTVLYGSYAANDLRKSLFFKKVAGKPYYNFNGSYDGTTSLFNGPATDEVYLVKAEALARAGKAGEALTSLNQLRKNRYASDSFMPLISTDPAEVLGWVLAERRKELILRGLRWTDLRRLNKEEAYKKTVVKLLNGQRYELPPGDARYTWPIPQVVIASTGIAQNP